MTTAVSPQQAIRTADVHDHVDAIGALLTGEWSLRERADGRMVPVDAMSLAAIERVVKEFTLAGWEVTIAKFSEDGGGLLHVKPWFPPSTSYNC